MELHRRHDVPLAPPGILATTLVQIPIGAALYRAVSTGFGPRAGFLWVSDLARPDALVAIGATLLAGVAAGAGPSGNRAAVATSMLITVAIAWRLSASVGLYWVASNAVGAVQSLLLLRKPVQA
jgi:membrane protein insertase Oxa1/YidC/SpoIIIJ